MNTAILNRRPLYVISFIEGGVVMVTEITGARILTPFFGASLYSWASTLSITLLALMTGYYAGGYITTRPRLSSSDKISWIFFMSGIAVLLMPSLGHSIMQKTLSLSFFTGLILSELCFLFLPIFLMGMISPMIIFHITKKAELSGRSAGNIYAISTCGGILFTLAFGFFIIPHYGITLPLRILGIAVAVLALAFLVREKIAGKKVALAALAGFILAIITFDQNKFREFPAGSKFEMAEYSEGLMGELKVINELSRAPNGNPVYIRTLKVNNIQQNCAFAGMPGQSLMYYVNFAKLLIPFLPEKASALMIGLGAGSLYKILRDQHMQVETVEIDQRIYDMGVKYFDMPVHSNCHITDGRYFINVCNKKYDMIVLDVIVGENVPGQLITLESFKKCYNLLSERGTLILEHGGVKSFADNSFIPSIAKTLKEAGFHLHLFNPKRSKSNGDILFVATRQPFDVENITLPDEILIKGGPLAAYELQVAAFDNLSARVITDDKSNVDLLLKEHYLKVRKSIRSELASVAAISKNN